MCPYPLRKLLCQPQFNACGLLPSTFFYAAPDFKIQNFERQAQSGGENPFLVFFFRSKIWPDVAKIIYFSPCLALPTRPKITLGHARQRFCDTDGRQQPALNKFELVSS
jgi:hypothetical protein